ncbi:hypothetical protein MRX96_013868 [Rhipicephalus microplus]
MDCLPPPEPLVLTNTPADNWKKFRQRIELYFKATETNKKRTPAQKAAIFLHVAGPEAIERGKQVLLGLNAAERFGLISRVHDVSSRSDVSTDWVTEFPGVIPRSGLHP